MRDGVALLVRPTPQRPHPTVTLTSIFCAACQDNPFLLIVAHRKTSILQCCRLGMFVESDAKP
jgi:hypothetical protein